MGVAGGISGRPSPILPEHGHPCMGDGGPEIPPVTPVLPNSNWDPHPVSFFTDLPTQVHFSRVFPFRYVFHAIVGSDTNFRGRNRFSWTRTRGFIPGQARADVYIVAIITRQTATFATRSQSAGIGVASRHKMFIGLSPECST